MHILDVKQRSWNAYLAGIGASGALMASAFVMFVILIGVVTFKTWPHTGGLLGGDHGQVALQGAATPAPARNAPHASGLNLVKLLGGQGSGTGLSRGSARSTGLDGSGLISQGNGGSGGSGEQPGGPGSGQPQGAQQPPSEPAQPSNVVSQTVSAVGNTVANDTESLGDTLGGSTSPGLGGLVGGVGRALNDNLQSLAGNR